MLIRQFYDSDCRTQCAFAAEEPAILEIARWGDSLTLPLPASLIDALELKEGDEIEHSCCRRAQFGVVSPA
jgi:hypothetical protein